jgi:5-oxoprolinase (ATP-hydrolysing) subunit B
MRVSPTIGVLGDQAVLIRFGSRLSDEANRCAIACAKRLRQQPPAGAVEVVANLVSVLVRYDVRKTSPAALTGELRLLLATLQPGGAATRRRHVLKVRFGGQQGPDLDEVAQRLDLSPDAFIAAHNAAPLRVLSTGFAPGFVYCGLHGPQLQLPRRPEVRPAVPPGTLLFAAGQTALTATRVPTGWHVIGSTAFNNFDPQADPPTILREGDAISFEAA